MHIRRGLLAALLACCLASAVGNASDGAECDLLLDGKPFVKEDKKTAMGWALHGALSGTQHQTVHTIGAQQVPCGGFLRKGSYYVRSRSTDAMVMVDIFFRHEFAFLDKLFGSARPPKRILDLGANAGYASAYFASAFPDARIAAVEPSSRNQPMVVLNTQFAKGRVLVFPGGIWHRPALLYIKSHAINAEWGFVVTELNDTTLATVPAKEVIPAFTVDQIMRSMVWDTIDFMKVDVECTELHMFGGAAPPEWLQHVTCLSMEIHPESFCGHTTKDQIFANMQTAGFELQGHHGELEVWCKKGFARRALRQA
jgi:FkbM family methyltransferase